MPEQPGRRPPPTPRGGLRARPWTGSKGRAVAAEAASRRAELHRGVRLRKIYLTVMAVVLAVGAVDVLLGSVGLVLETQPRRLTADERARYVAQEVARRWHAWPVGMIFPEELPYLALSQSRMYAQRVGVAPEAPCAAAVDPVVASVLTRHGCHTVLRATYVDQSATFAVTVGIAVLPDEQARVDAMAELPADNRVGVRPAAFPGTVADAFGEAQRQRTGWQGVGPYVIFSAVGYTDGRTREAIAPQERLPSEMWPLAQTIMGRVARALGEPPEVPRCTQGDVC